MTKTSNIYGLPQNKVNALLSIIEKAARTESG